MILTTGKEQCARILMGDSLYYWKYIQLGTDNTAETLADTALVAEVLEASATVAFASPNIVRLTYTWTFVAPYSLKEAGVANKAVASTPAMLTRKTYTAVPVYIGDIMAVTWDVAVSA